MRPSRKDGEASALSDPAGGGHLQIDEIDRKIIAALRADGRRSLRQLAPETGLKEAAVAARIRRLTEDRILHVTAVVDMAAAGYPVQFLSLLKVRGRPVEEVADEIAGIEEVLGLFIVLGQFDVAAWVRARNLDEVGTLVHRRIGAVRGVDRVETDICLELRRYDPYVAIVRSLEPSPLGGRLEELDRRIIGALQENGRSSNREVARRLGVSEKTVRDRLKRLEDGGVVRIRAVGDIERASGLRAGAMVGINVHPGEIGGVMQALLALPSVSLAFTAVGRHDVIVGVTAPDPAALTALVLRMGRIPGVESTVTYQMGLTVKHDFRWVRITD